MKLVYAPHLGHDVVVGGRKRPKSYARRLNFAQVAPPSLSVPSSTSYETPAMTALRQMFLNDSEGDCVIAGRGHRIGILTANAGAPYVYTDAQINLEYERIGGFDPKHPDTTDQGCDMSVAADDGVTVGYADGSKDLGWIDVDATNKTQVMEAIYLFEDGDLGLELPDAWISPFPEHDDFVWDVAGAPNPENGHCVQIVDYDITRGVRISTWGLLGWITWAALAKYGAKTVYGELIIHLSPDQIAKAAAKAPNGFDWATIVNFFDQFGGHVPVPAPLPPAPSPSPSPTPAPVPAAGVTLQLAESWALADFHNAHKVLTKAQAQQLVMNGLTRHWPKG